MPVPTATHLTILINEDAAFNLKPQYAPDIPEAIISPMTIQKSIKSLLIRAPQNITLANWQPKRN
ncbi:MAG: hypothetical protein ACI832_000078 [Rheinheimera aquimaris]|jgi:hypothetical protein|tara:strand:- start:2836 stop:3030 length:195 start_codon:yes stop_codon:yes gene_type:complete